MRTFTYVCKIHIHVKFTYVCKSALVNCTLKKKAIKQDLDDLAPTFNIKDFVVTHIFFLRKLFINWKYQAIEKLAIINIKRVKTHCLFAKLERDCQRSGNDIASVGYMKYRKGILKY